MGAAAKKMNLVLTLMWMIRMMMMMTMLMTVMKMMRMPDDENDDAEEDDDNGHFSFSVLIEIDLMESFLSGMSHAALSRSLFLPSMIIAHIYNLLICCIHHIMDKHLTILGSISHQG